MKERVEDEEFNVSMLNDIGQQQQNHQYNTKTPKHDDFQQNALIF